ncbi:hypothetical protein COY26_02955 [Candidatus Woesearchaeota archaeon CG_4_10_14_0_2_um_filter_33_10]|nr:MAG: hypothetical protein COV14_05265 [Candidatus Woesearchaeota archaeon CG10_big_fil_rev_8_21_14_0_10_33_12]PIZ53025.1 MAG: hypothetical protein COY26_02955 [Candidatus Woesearchaeota archaeon CG_4_10_14_0_2_um_filter_33_10]
MKEYKGIFDTVMYDFVCCQPGKYKKYTNNLSEENKQKCLKVYNCLKEISPGLLDGKDLIEKIQEIEKNQKFSLNVKEEKGYCSIDVQIQDLNIELAHFEAVRLTK